jgi:hypothetical protein
LGGSRGEDGQVTNASDEDGQADLHLILAGGFRDDRVIVWVSGLVVHSAERVTTSPLTDVAREWPPISVDPDDVEVTVEVPSRDSRATAHVHLARGEQRWVVASFGPGGELRLDDSAEPLWFG